MQAFSKINLYLEVLEKRSDGYHNLSTVMQSLGLCDLITLSTEVANACRALKLQLTCDDPHLPVDKRNLVYRAADYILKRYKINVPVSIKIEKNIPIAAGLGGGSSDCAATLVGLNKLFSLGLTADELCEIGLTFGADVPFCIRGGTQLAEGVGERLTILPPHPTCWIVLARVPVEVSTANIFSKIRLDRTRAEQSDKNVITTKNAIAAGNVAQIAGAFYNRLTGITAAAHPEVNELIMKIKTLGAINAAMSGSGPTVFGYFNNEDTAKNACAELKKTIQSVYITQPERMRMI
ncbi:MAG: 4-(cytidine 5'-diphospho)-2-C-methyl-D-erythritol kinase [Defluviitaleaceae bacterium]|nr:4-(cytidine 5'-diphospho)-2-C-methyl-D-erythritol kinase [Defluviitaleaceae bacterium]